jgi:hypothetical protein
MARYQGTPDLRSALEDERRSNGFKPVTWLVTAIIGLIVVVMVLACLAKPLGGLFDAIGYETAPMNRRVVDAYGNTCIVADDAHPKRGNDYLTAPTPEIAEACRQNIGGLVTLRLDAFGQEIRSITPVARQ